MKDESMDYDYNQQDGPNIDNVSNSYSVSGSFSSRIDILRMYIFQMMIYTLNKNNHLQLKMII